MQTYCPFCTPDRLTATLTTTEHFRVVADHAPVVSGHTLIMPIGHFACYGAVPAEWDAELAALRTRVSAFLAKHYADVLWLEHGVFHQTVFHAHLHALPFGPFAPSITAEPALEGIPLAGHDHLRAWYAANGHYTYLQEPGGAETLFPAAEARYRRVLGALRDRRGTAPPWCGPIERRLGGAPLMRDLIARWQAYSADAE